MSRSQVLVVSIALLAALGLYAMHGQPLRGDEPFTERQAEIAAKDPMTLTPAETLSRLQHVARERPEDPEPHYHIGVLLKSTGRLEDSVRAYQSALRRNDRHVPSLVGLGDVLIRLGGGEIDDTVIEVYERAWTLDPGQVRPGILAGYGLSLKGETDAANEIWTAIDRTLSDDDPRRAMFDAILGAESSETLSE